MFRLEHKAIYSQLLYNEDAYSASDWWNESLQWSGQLQFIQKFRKSKQEETYHLFFYTGFERSPAFYWFDPENKNHRFKKANTRGTQIQIEKAIVNIGEGINSWFELDPLVIYKKLKDDFEKKGINYDLQQISEKFGGVNIIHYNDNLQIYHYDYQFGLHNKV